MATDSGVAEGFQVRFLALLEDGGAESTWQLTYSLPFAVQVAGARPGAEVTLVAMFQDQRSDTTFIAQPDGTVDTRRDAPADGGYSGPDVEGILWSARRSTGATDQTFNVRIEAVSDEQFARATLERPGMGFGTVRTSVTAGVLPGHYFTWPERRPAVLVLGGSECSLNSTSFNAAYVSTSGFHALAVDYCRGGYVSDVPLEGLVRAIDWLAQRPEVDSSRLAVFGGSRGGELALQLASMDSRIKAVVGVVPSPYRWGGTESDNGAAWTVAGTAIPFMPDTPNPSPATERLADGTVATRFTPVFEQALGAASAGLIEAATILIGGSAASFLLIGAEDDGVWPSCRFATEALESLKRSRHTDTHPLDQASCLSQAGHAIGPPGWSTVQGYARAHPSGVVLVMGGTQAGRGRANRRFDTLWRRFLRSSLQ